MQQDSNQKTIIIATLSFIVGFGLSWLIATNKTTVPTEKERKDVSSEVKDSESVELNAVSVSDQTEGVTVSIDYLKLTELSWVAVHEDDNGVPGRILGAQLFDPGTWETGKVELLRGTLAGNTYYAVLHKDNGDRAFDPKKDLPLTDSKENQIVAKFTATKASVE